MFFVFALWPVAFSFSIGTTSLFWCKIFLRKMIFGTRTHRLSILLDQWCPSVGRENSINTNVVKTRPDRPVQTGNRWTGQTRYEPFWRWKLFELKNWVRWDSNPVQALQMMHSTTTKSCNLLCYNMSNNNIYYIFI